MADYLRILVWFCVVLLTLDAVLSSSIVKRDVLEVEQLQQPQQLEPVIVGTELNGDLMGGDDGMTGDRDKRFVKFAVVKKIGLKAVLLNFVFGKINSIIDAKTNAVSKLDRLNVFKNAKLGIHPPPNPPKLKPTERPPVEFQTNSPVSLVIPDRLYGGSFSLITNISKIIGDVLYNTADRAQELADRLNEKARHKLGFKTQIFSIKTGSSSSSSSAYG